MNQYEQATSLLDESMSIHQILMQNSQVPSDNNQQLAYAETLNAHGMLHKLKGEFDSAIPYFKQSIDIVQDIDPYHNEMAAALNSLAGIQHIQGQFALAVKNMRQVLLIQKRIHTEQHSYYTRGLNNLVTILTDLEDFEEATTLSQQSLKIQINMLGKEHPYVGNTLRALGILAHRQGDFEGAKQYLLDALSNKRQTHTQDNLTIGVILLFLGAVYQDLGEFEQANIHYQRMLAIMEDVKAANRLLGRAICQPASLAYAQGDWQASYSLYQQALTLLPPKGMRTSIAQLGFARAALKMDMKLAQAQELASSALLIRQQSYVSGHSMIAQAQGVLGLVKLRLGQNSEALLLLESAHQVLNQHALFKKQQSADNLLDSIQQALATRI